MAEEMKADKYMALVLGPAWLTEIKSSDIKVVTTLELLMEDVFKPTDHHVLLRLFISGQYLKTLVEQKIVDSPQVDSITIFYDLPIDLIVHAKQYQNVSPKLHFRATTELQACLSSYANVSTPQSTARPTRAKRGKHSKSKKFTTTLTTNPDILCPKCKKIFDQPFQLSCGHRQCKSCLDKQSGYVKCRLLL